MSFLFKHKKDRVEANSSSPGRNEPHSEETTPKAAASGPLADSTNGMRNYNAPKPTDSSELTARTTPPNVQSTPPMQSRRMPSSKEPQQQAAWSKRSFDSNLPCPFPRYGHAGNGVASKDGDIYVFGGLVGEEVVNDVWVVNAAKGTTTQLETVGDVPTPRVGHSGVLLGNAFIVFGGDTKVYDEDVNDNELYLLNTNTKLWQKARLTGPKPVGRYGHSVNVIGVNVIIFGGQVDGSFFNELAIFDLNTLTAQNPHWETIRPSTRSPQPRTNHSAVSTGSKLYVFGGTDGVNWFNDLWMFDLRIHHWVDIKATGPLPIPREGHSSCLVGDTIYVFGGRDASGADLGDVIAFRIPDEKWYTITNAGPSPSARSGHRMSTVGRRVVVLGGENGAGFNKDIISAFVLDTGKLKYNDDGTVTVTIGRAPSAPSPSAIPAPRSRSAGHYPSKTTSPARGDQNNALGSPLHQAYRSPKSDVADGFETANVVDRSKSSPKPTNAFGPSLSNPKIRKRDDTGEEQPNHQATELDQRVVDRSNREGRFPADVKTNLQDASRSFSEPTPVERSQPQVFETAPAFEQPANASSTGAYSSGRVSEDNPRLQEPSITRSQEPSPTSPAGQPDAVPAVAKVTTLERQNRWLREELAHARSCGFSPSADSSHEKSLSNVPDTFVQSLMATRKELDSFRKKTQDEIEHLQWLLRIEQNEKEAAIKEASFNKTQLEHSGSRGGVQAHDQQQIDDLNLKLLSSIQHQEFLQRNINDLSRQLEDSRQAKPQLQIDDIRTELESVMKSRDSVVAELDQLRNSHQAARSLHHDESAAHIQTKAQMDLSKAKAEQLESQLKLKSAQAARLSNIIMSFGVAVDRASQRTETLERQLDSEILISNGLRDEITTLHSDLNGFKTREGALHGEVERLSDSLTSVIESEKSAKRALVLASAKFGEEDRSLEARVAETHAALDQHASSLRQLQDNNRMNNESMIKELNDNLSAVRERYAKAVKDSLRLRKNYLDTQRLNQQLHSQLNIQSLGSRFESTPQSTREESDTTTQKTGAQDPSTAHSDIEEARSRADSAEERLRESTESFRERLGQLESDYAAARKYVSASEQSLRMMKEEVQRMKAANRDLQRQLAQSSSPPGSLERLEQIESKSRENERQMQRLTEENQSLHARVRESENKVALLLDQMDRSMSNYRQSLTIPDVGEEHGSTAINSLTADLEQLRAQMAVTPHPNGK